MSMFVHLHVHTMYSVLDGMPKIRELLETAKEMGQEAIAITDHGSTSALWEAQELGKEIGIKVIHGNEFYYQRENDDKNGHLIVLAKNNIGLSNLFKLQEYSYVENFYRKPRIDFDALVKHKEGLIVCSACLGSTMNQYLLEGNYVEAMLWATKFKYVFGDDFYIEIQPNNIPEQIIANQGSIRIAKELNIKLIATNDVHYIFEEDAFPHEVLLAMQIGKKMSDEKRFRFDTADFWLKSEKEMYDAFYNVDMEIVKQAIANTVLVADKCNAEIKVGKYLPTYHSIPEGSTERSLLVEKTLQGARAKGKISDKEYMEDVQNEIDIVDRNGYSGYFLVVQDFVNSARTSGILVGDGRGSGAGSKVAYLTDITRIEPRTYDLLFERFMSDGRSPDFDIDFSDQDAVFRDLQAKYGEANVAHIIAFGTLTPKAVVRKIFSAFGYSMAEIKKINSIIPEDCKSIADLLLVNKDLQALHSKYSTEFEVIKRLEGVVSHESQHAGGVIIYPNISSILPIKTKGEDRTKRVVAFDKYMLESMGHYKFDILGLETLPVIKRCIDTIKETGIDINLYDIDLEDQNVYTMLANGDVSGVFQLSAQATKVMEQKPTSFRDLIAINALIRPGVGDWNEYIARRQGKQWHKDPLRHWMHETMGTMTYQEQYLLDCHHLAGWDIAYADKKVRKNRDIRNDVELKEKFLSDSSHESKEQIWEEICDAVDGGYSFNKSHSASYAMLSYQTAWLKHYYPIHFYASLMSSEKTDGDGQSAIAGYIAECKQRGIEILPPDINNSNEDFVPTDKGIQYRITTITHVGESAIKNIKKLRPIESLADLMERRAKSSIKKNVLMNLVKAGAFDCENPNRAELLWQIDLANRTNKEIKENYQPTPYEWNDTIKAEWEKQVLGSYLSVHPMERFGFKPIGEFQDGAQCLQGGEIYDTRIFHDKNKNEMAFIFIDTLFGNIKVVVFSYQWNEKLKEDLVIGELILVKGKKSGDSIILNQYEILK